MAASSQGREYVRLGRAIRVLRIERDLSQERFGNIAGMHRNYVGAIERGEINPTFRVLARVASGLEIPISELLARYERTSDPVRLRRRRSVR
jgi:transcriptional regulator with XRE-family HTH domain